MKERSDIMGVDESMMSPRTKRQIRMYEELFRKFEDSGFDVSSLYDADKYVDRAIKVSDGPGWVDDMIRQCPVHKEKN